METEGVLSGNESDTTVVLEYGGDWDTSREVPSLQEVSDGNIRASTNLLSVEDVGAETDSSLDFGSDSEETGADTSRQFAVIAAKELYTSVGYYSTLGEAEQTLHGLNGFVYTYRTRYLSPFVLGKVYQCRSHVSCNHRLKLAPHRADENSFRYQLLQRGQNCGPSVRLLDRGISPVLKPEIDALLRLGMSAGRVRNMLLFKYMREPNMLMHVPVVRKMENRKAYLKKKASGGWEMNKFATMRNWTALKVCQDHATYHNVDKNNVADMNSLIVLDDFEHTTVDGDRQVASMGMIVTIRALFNNVRQAVLDQGSELIMSTDGTYRSILDGGLWSIAEEFLWR